MKINASSKPLTSAFALIGMMLVLAVGVLVIGAGVIHLRGIKGVGNDVNDRMNLRALSVGVQMDVANAVRFPTTEQGLKALLVEPATGPKTRSWRPQIKSANILIGHWGNDVQYRYPGSNGVEFSVFSLGEDGAMMACVTTAKTIFNLKTNQRFQLT